MPPEEPDAERLVPSSDRIPIPAGFRLIIFLFLYGLGKFVVQATLSQIPAFRAWVAAQNPKIITPGTEFAFAGTELLVLLITMRTMAAGERRSYALYGLPLNQVFGRRFWQGIVLGLAMVSLLMALISLFNGYSLGALALSPAAAIKYGVLYAAGFLIVGLFEELLFRGYALSTLAGGIGFWPAALALAILFGTLHIPNQANERAGAVWACCFGLLAAFSLLRTGSLWLAIGMHTAFDWGNAFLYSAPAAGLTARDHLLNSTLHGPIWLCGGNTGPQGSIFAFVVLALAAICIHYTFPSGSA